VIFKRPLAARLLVMAALLALYFSSDWSGLRSALGASSAHLLSLLGYTVTLTSRESSVYLAFSDTRLLITPACTYLDLAFILAPFTWRAGQRLAANLFRAVAVTLAVLSLNAGRLVLTAVLYHGGAAWPLSHDLPDLALYYPAIATAVLLCARSDWRWPGTEAAHSAAGNA
jgi:hypothetical protein